MLTLNCPVYLGDEVGGVHTRLPGLLSPPLSFLICRYGENEVGAETPQERIKIKTNDEDAGKEAVRRIWKWKKSRTK